MYLDYSIRNVGPSPTMKEEVNFINDFEYPTSTEDHIVLAIPNDFTLLNSDKFTGPTSDLTHQYYKVKPKTIFTNPINENRTIKEGKTEEFTIKLRTPIKSPENIGKQYTISVYFLDDAYIFKGVALKDTAVKP